MDDAIEARASDEGLEYGDCFDKYDFKAAQLAITQKWLKNFNEKTGLNIKFHDIDSPREYNFTTDRVFGTIKKDEFQKIRDVVSFDALKSVVERTFTSRDGFISFYTTDMDHWMKTPTDELTTMKLKQLSWHTLLMIPMMIGVLLMILKKLRIRDGNELTIHGKADGRDLCYFM